MMTLEACVAFDTRSNPIDFGVKVTLRKVEFVVGGGICPFKDRFHFIQKSHCLQIFFGICHFGTFLCNFHEFLERLC